MLVLHSFLGAPHCSSTLVNAAQPAWRNPESDSLASCHHPIHIPSSLSKPVPVAVFSTRGQRCHHCSHHHLHPAAGHPGERALLPLQKGQALRPSRKERLVSATRGTWCIKIWCVLKYTKKTITRAVWCGSNTHSVVRLRCEKRGSPGKLTKLKKWKLIM